MKSKKISLSRSPIHTEQDRCIAIINQYLVYDSQRAVSWHEIQDCIEAIRRGDEGLKQREKQ